MKTSFVLLSFLILISVCSCNNTSGPSIDDTVTLAPGEYSGTYTCIHDFGSEHEKTATCTTEFQLWNDWYYVKEMSYLCPPRSSGECRTTSATISFTDHTIHHDDFDHTLIIDGTYDYSFDKLNLELSQIDTVTTDTTHIRKYIYRLKLASAYY